MFVHYRCSTDYKNVCDISNVFFQSVDVAELAVDFRSSLKARKLFYEMSKSKLVNYLKKALSTACCFCRFVLCSDVIKNMSLIGINFCQKLMWGNITTSSKGSGMIVSENIFIDEL